MVDAFHAGDYFSIISASRSLETQHRRIAAHEIETWTSARANVEVDVCMPLFPITHESRMHIERTVSLPSGSYRLVAFGKGEPRFATSLDNVPLQGVLLTLPPTVYAHHNHSHTSHSDEVVFIADEELVDCEAQATAVPSTAAGKLTPQQGLTRPSISRHETTPAPQYQHLCTVGGVRSGYSSAVVAAAVAERMHSRGKLSRMRRLGLRRSTTLDLHDAQLGAADAGYRIDFAGVSRQHGNYGETASAWGGGSSAPSSSLIFDHAASASGPRNLHRDQSNSGANDSSAAPPNDPTASSANGPTDSAHDPLVYSNNGPGRPTSSANDGPSSGAGGGGPRHLFLPKSITSGNRSVLAVRIRFADQADSDAIEPSDADTIMTTAAANFARMSYGAMSMNLTMPQNVIVVPVTTSSAPSAGTISTLATASILATTGLKVSGFQHFVILMPWCGWLNFGGLGSLLGTSVWLNFQDVDYSIGV